MVRSHIKQLKYFPAAKNNAKPAMRWPKIDNSSFCRKIQKHDASTLLYIVHLTYKIMRNLLEFAMVRAALHRMRLKMRNRTGTDPPRYPCGRKAGFQAPP